MSFRLRLSPAELLLNTLCHVAVRNERKPKVND